MRIYPYERILRRGCIVKYTIQRMRDCLGRRTKKTALEITENPVISKAVLCYFMLSLQALASRRSS